MSSIRCNSDVVDVKYMRCELGIDSANSNIYIDGDTVIESIDSVLQSILVRNSPWIRKLRKVLPKLGI